MKQKYRIPLAAALAVALLFINIPLIAFPQFVPMDERYEQSQVVIHGDIIKLKTRKLTSRSIIVNLRVRVLEVLKGQPKFKQKFLNLTFLAFPDTVENHLIQPPKKGRYIFFLQNKTVTDSQGRKGTTLVLYEPRVFAIVEPKPIILKDLKLLKKK